MATVGSLIVNVLANTAPLTAGLTKARVAVAAFAAGSAVATAATAALAVALFKLHSSNEQIQQSMTHSLAIMKGVTAFQRNQMLRVAVETAKVTIHSTSEVADAYYELASANMDAQQAMEAMPSVAQFAMAGNFNLARATKLAAGALYGLQLNSVDNTVQLKNMTMIMDKLVTVTTLAQTNTENFAEGLVKSSGALRAAGMGIDEGLPLLAAFARMNIEGAEAATALQIILREFKHKAVENAEGFEKYNVKVFDSSRNMRNMADILRDMTNAFRGFSTERKVAAVQEMGFQKKSMRFIELMSGMEIVMEDVEESLKDYGGRMEEVAKSQMTPFQAAMENLKGTWDSLAVSNQALTTSLGIMADEMAGLIEWLEKARVKSDSWSNSVETMVPPIIKLLDILHAVKVAVAALKWTFKQLSNSVHGVFMVLIASVGTSLEWISFGWIQKNEDAIGKEWKRLERKIHKANKEMNKVLTDKTPSEKWRAEQEKNMRLAAEAEAKAQKLKKDQAAALKKQGEFEKIQKKEALMRDLNNITTVWDRLKAFGSAVKGRSGGGGLIGFLGKSGLDKIELQPGRGKEVEERGVSQALELGTMEAYQAAMRGNLGAVDPQKKIVVNTKKIAENTAKMAKDMLEKTPAGVAGSAISTLPSLLAPAGNFATAISGMLRGMNMPRGMREWQTALGIDTKHFDAAQAKSGRAGKRQELLGEVGGMLSWLRDKAQEGRDLQSGVKQDGPTGPQTAQRPDSQLERSTAKMAEDLGSFLDHMSAPFVELAVASIKGMKN